MTTDNTITVTLCDDPCSFGEMLTDINQLEALKATWKARVESSLSYLAEDGYAVEVWYGSRTKVEAPVEAPVGIEHSIKMAIDDAWDAWCADGIPS